MKWLIYLGVILAAIGLLVLGGQHDTGPLVITREGDQKLILQFGRARKTTVPGWDWKIPMIEEVEPYPSRWRRADTKPFLADTKDGEQLQVDHYVVWRITEPRDFRETFQRNLSAAESRIDRVVQDVVREVMGRHTMDEVLTGRREGVTRDITAGVAGDLAGVGVEIRDVRVSRAELPGSTEDSVFARMKTERERLAKKSRAEGDEKARGIRAEANRDARIIVANARRNAEIISGTGDAEAARIYAEAHGADPEFYAFLRSLEAYKHTIDANTTLIVSPDSEFFKYLGGGTK
jgi:membrane protease subunit HflC